MQNISGIGFLHDDQVLPVDSYDLSFYEQGPTLYEVFGFQNKKFFFSDDHFKRLDISSSLAHLDIWMDREQILLTLRKVMEMNHADSGSINISFIFSVPKHFTAHFIAPLQLIPDDQYYGISAGLLHAERHNPRVKFFNPAFRRTADKAIADQNVHEVILVDRSGYLTEGSRSNIFLIKDDHIVTTPVNHVLAGITREYVIDICKQLDFTIVEERVKLKKLGEFSSAFLTGTTSRVLPVRSIGDKNFRTGIPLIQQIRDKYNEVIERVIK
jgi:branched-chain amino acid aminotransferase